MIAKRLSFLIRLSVTLSRKLLKCGFKVSSGGENQIKFRAGFDAYHLGFVLALTLEKMLNIIP